MADWDIGGEQMSYAAQVGRSRAPIPRIARVLLGLLVAGALALNAARAASSVQADATGKQPVHPTPWEYAAYRIVVFIKIDPSAEWSPKRRADLTELIEKQARALVGGLWRLKASEAPAELHWDSAAEIGRVESDRVPKTALEADKVMLLGLTEANGRLTIRTRELDVRTQVWGAPLTVESRRSGELADQLVRALWQSFSPIVRIDGISDQGVVTCRVRGGALPPANHSLELIRPGTVLRPLIRHFDAQGKTARDGVFPVAWTWLQVEQTDGPTAMCRLISGVQEPLEFNHDGRSEYLGLAVTARANDSTNLIVRARGDSRTLEDVEVFARKFARGPPLLVGRTDEHGAVKIESPQIDSPMLYLRSGEDMLVRFPLVPGLEREVTIPVNDNGRRLETGDLVARAADELIDLVAQQALLKTRLQRELVSGRLDSATATLDTLKALKTSDAYVKSLDARRMSLPNLAGDPAAAAWLEKYLAEIKPLAGKLLSTQDIARLDDLLAKKRAAQQTSGAVK
jgi:hypothetical protein